MKKSINLNPKRMMFFKISLSLILILISNQLFSSIISVDNNYPKIGDFATLQEAHDAANNGDTIYVFPSLASYSTIKVIKKLYFLGAGFQTFQVGLRSTLMDGTFEFLSGADGSTLAGFGGNFNVIIDANNISIQRNNAKGILVKTGHLGTVISQNFLNDIYNYFLIDVESENEVILSNNIIKNHSLWYGPNGNNSNNGKGIRANQTTNTSIIIHNIIDLANTTYSIEAVAMDVGSSNTIAYNNIVLIGSIAGIQTEFYNNLISPDIENVFIDFRQNNYKLKQGSPAIGSGLNGADMGIYGGETPFIDGGYPSIPSIYYLDVPLIGNKKDGINVTLKAKTNK